MLAIKKLNTKVVQHFFETLYQNVTEQWKLVIMQDRQSSPRPLDGNGNLKTYLLYRVETPRTPQWMTKLIVEIDGATVERTISQKTLHIIVNFLGKDAVSAANYFSHAINSNLAYTALRPTVDGSLVELQYNACTEPVDLTEIELTKWVSRVQMEITLGYLDIEDFNLDVFDTVEVTELVEAAGIPAKPIIIRNKEV